MNLREVRIKKGLTQQELATKIGKDRTLITKIENERTLPSVETAKLIAKELDISWTVFFEKIIVKQ